MPGLPTIGPLELLLILGILLLVLGPGKLPGVGAALGQTIREFRKASSDLQESASPTTPPPPREPESPRDPETPRGTPADPADDRA